MGLLPCEVALAHTKHNELGKSSTSGSAVMAAVAAPAPAAPWDCVNSQPSGSWWGQHRSCPTDSGDVNVSEMLSGPTVTRASARCGFSRTGVDDDDDDDIDDTITGYLA